MALEVPLRKIKFGQKSILSTGPSIWNKLTSEMKVLNTVISSTHNIKKLVLKNLSN